MEVKIIVKTEVQCPQFSVRILLSLCRCCPYYRYETVDGKVMCNWVGEPKGKPEQPKFNKRE